MTIYESINKNNSILGKHILEWITAPQHTKSSQENEIANKLYYRYVADSQGNLKNKIYPDVYYYVNYNNRIYSKLYIAYIVRDKLKSPRLIADALKSLNIVGTDESYKGSLICEWAYYQNSSSENEFYIEGCDIVTKYLESKTPLKKNVYYYVVNTSRGIRVFRDTSKSPRKFLAIAQP